MNVLLPLFVGLLAGAVAGKTAAAPVKRSVNLAVGVLGASIGAFLFAPLGLAARGLFGSLATAALGAFLLLFAVGLVRRTT